MSDPMKVCVEIEVQEIADAIIRKLTEDETHVEVVRCKDCKHYLDGGCGNDDSQSPSKNLMGVKPNWFCADGARDINIPSKSDGGKRA